MCVVRQKDRGKVGGKELRKSMSEECPLKETRRLGGSTRKRLEIDGGGGKKGIFIDSVCSVDAALLEF